MFARPAKRVVGPMSAETLDHDYTSGRWDYLEEPSELARFAAIAGYVCHLRPNGKILDVGAGSGHLRSFFDESKIATYVGMDFSREAVRRASNRDFQRTRFEFADMNAGPVPGCFDAIIFAESLQYAAQLGPLFKAYCEALNPGGICVVSMFKGAARSAEVWREITKVKAPAHGVRLSNERDMVWDIKVFAF